MRYGGRQRIVPTHEVTHHRRTLTAMQCPQGFLDRPVIGGDALMLA